MSRINLQNGVATLHRLQKEMDQMFGGLFNEKTTPVVGIKSPAVNVWEKEGGFVLEAELPGFSLNDLEITVEGAEVVLRGERKAEAPAPNSTLHKRERWFGKFERRLEFPIEIDADKAEAVMRDGVLTLTLPKSPAAAARKIAIKSV
jgi:HSP20 family protein